MAQGVYYRYFRRYPQGQDELEQLQRERMVRTSNPNNGFRTWFTPARFRDPAVAQRLLALDHLPEFRVGPIPADEMPEFDALGPQIVQPVGNLPGGAVEVCTTQPVYIFGCYNLVSSDWEPL